MQNLLPHRLHSCNILELSGAMSPEPLIAKAMFGEKPINFLEPSGAIWSNAEPWRNLQPSEAIWSNPEASGAIWSHLEPSIWSHLEPSRAIWTLYLEPPGATSSHREALGVIEGFQSKSIDFSLLFIAKM